MGRGFSTPAPGEEMFARFAEWTSRFAGAATPQAREALAAEGVLLARARLTALAELIQSNPQRALELAVPMGRRGRLPTAVKALLEEPVNTRADLNVMCVLRAGEEHEHGVETIRTALLRGGKVPTPSDVEPGKRERSEALGTSPALDSSSPEVGSSGGGGVQEYRVWTFGRGLDYMTHSNAPLNGIALPLAAAGPVRLGPFQAQPDGLMALAASPARLYDPEEAAAWVAANPAQAVACRHCSGALEGSGTTVSVLGGEAAAFCSLAHAEEWTSRAVAAEGLDKPQFPVVEGDTPQAKSSYTEGTKRLLFMRVGFPDVTNTIGSNTAVTLIGTLSNYFATMSNGKLVVAPVGSSGSAVTHVMRMPNNASYYNDAGLSRLYPDGKSAASAAGYPVSSYHFIVVFTTGSQPSYGYAGLGYVGGVGVHIANGYWQNHTVSHELGHNLGLWHAKRWNTSNRSIIGDGEVVEYGNYYDQMGTFGDDRQHYGASYKNFIDWIPDAHVQTAGSGTHTYRLYAHDRIFSTGLRGLKISRNGSQDYWAEYRQLWSDRDMRNGLLLQYTEKDGNPGTMLDAMPAVDGDGLVVGRTFSDPTAGVHITPTARGSVDPDWLDVTVTVGSVATNKAPFVRVSASATTASTGQAITFTASASDTNGDALAFYWEFGDGSYTVDNEAQVSHSFSSAGEYPVQCVVSDMKGGTARDTVIVRIGSPSTYRISGRIFATDGLPLVGMKVTAGSKATFTDSDGSYSITGLGAGSYTVAAQETVSDAMTFTAFFNNPVAVGPSFTGADFVAGDTPAVVYTTLVASNATWRYLDTGTNAGTNWRTAAFSDSTWSNGPAILGYGNSNEATVVSYGPDPANKYITTYFRRNFSVSAPSNYASLRLEVLRDDGVVVYLNGNEIFRDNMPTGAVNHLTPALSTVEPGAYLTTNLPISVLAAGNNLLAAEVHQVEPTSSDITFGALLRGATANSVTGLKLAYISSPAEGDNLVFATNVAIAAVAEAQGASVARLDFYVDNVKIGQDGTSPYSLNWTNPAGGAHSLKVVAVFDTSVTFTSAPVTVTIIPPPVALSLVPTGAVWRYFNTNAAPAGAWLAPAYDDAAWRTGAAVLGYGNNNESTLLSFGPESTNKWTAAYFRHRFVVDDPLTITNLTLKLMRDDGAAVYLNGVEIVRDNLPTGALAYATLATNAVTGTSETNYFSFPVDPLLLRPGFNHLAAELHQADVTSSDFTFAATLTSLGGTNRPRSITLTSPASGALLTVPGNFNLAVDLLVGGGLGVSKVQYRDGASTIGESTECPWSYVWTNPPGGAHTLRAVALDSAGGSITSAPVSVTVRTPQPESALVNFGELWRYLDTGVDPATNWVNPTNFSDTLWNLGAARLGYGGDGENTVVGFGPDSSAKFITTWFRKSFTVANPAVFTNLGLRVVRDDGVIVYLNGTEVFRHNLPAGAIGATNFATSAISGAGEVTPLEAVITNLLRAGTNVIAAEVHQSSLTSSDLGFDLALTGVIATNTANGVFITSPAQGERFTLPAVISLSAYARGSSVVTNLEYLADGAKIAEAPALPYDAVWTNATAGAHTLVARARLANGTALDSPPVLISVAQRAFAVTATPAGADWRYLDDGSDAGTAWRESGFDDSGWSNGLAKFGFGDAGMTTLLATNRGDGSRIVTYYFRRGFTLPDDILITNFVLRFQRDDAAIVYLNGAEIFRDTNMPAGPVDFTTFARTSIGGATETLWLEYALDPSPLQTGLNVLAVEVHQSGTNSSDVGFDLQLIATGGFDPHVEPPSPPRMNLAWTGQGAFQVSFSEAEGLVFIIDASTNLQTWQPVATNAVSGGQLHFQVNPAGAPRQFYRVRWQP